MSILTKSDLLTLDFASDGQPFVRVVGKDTIDTAGLDFASEGQPFVAAGGTGSTPPVGGAHTHWRLNISANAGASNLTVMEVEMHASVGGADQCTGGTPDASSEYSVDFAPAKAFDDDTGGYWAAADPLTTGWLSYQFASPVEVAEYVIVGNPWVPNYNPGDWTLEYSDNAAVWTVADTQSGITWTNSEIKTFLVELGEPSGTLVRPVCFVCT